MTVALEMRRKGSSQKCPLDLPSRQQMVTFKSPASVLQVSEIFKKMDNEKVLAMHEI